MPSDNHLLLKMGHHNKRKKIQFKILKASKLLLNKKVDRERRIVWFLIDKGKRMGSRKRKKGKGRFEKLSRRV